MVIKEPDLTIADAVHDRSSTRFTVAHAGFLGLDTPHSLPYQRAQYLRYLPIKYCRVSRAQGTLQSSTCERESGHSTPSLIAVYLMVLCAVTVHETFLDQSC